MLWSTTGATLKVPAITACMVARGHSDEVILKVLGENFMRVFEQVWNG